MVQWLNVSCLEAVHSPPVCGLQYFSDHTLIVMTKMCCIVGPYREVSRTGLTKGRPRVVKSKSLLVVVSSFNKQMCVGYSKKRAL